MSESKKKTLYKEEEGGEEEFKSWIARSNKIAVKMMGVLLQLIEELEPSWLSIWPPVAITKGENTNTCIPLLNSMTMWPSPSLPQPPLSFSLQNN